MPRKDKKLNALDQKKHREKVKAKLSLLEEQAQQTAELTKVLKAHL